MRDWYLLRDDVRGIANGFAPGRMHALAFAAVLAAAGAGAAETGGNALFTSAAGEGAELASRARAQAARFGAGGKRGPGASARKGPETALGAASRGRPAAPGTRVAVAGACGWSACWDPCSNGYRRVPGDACALVFDTLRGCLAASGTCGAGAGPDSPAGGGSAACGTIYCYDPCSRGFRHVRGASCTTVLDPVSGCSRAAGTCP